MPAQPPKPLRKRPPEKKPSVLFSGKTWLVAGLLLLLLVVPLGALYSAGVFDGLFEVRVNQETYEQIREGMSHREIRRLLGKPTLIDRRAIPRLSGPAAKYASPDWNYPLRHIWKDEEDVIWADVLKGRVVKFGATLDGEQLGADPDPSKIGLKETPKEDAEE